MQRSENFQIPSTDIFSEAFDGFQASRQFERLQRKYQIRPFFERAKPVKIIADVSGYLLNGFSAATAFAFVFGFLAGLLPFKTLSVAFAVTFLVILEGLKRLTIPSIFKDFLQFKRLNFGAVAFAVMLSAGSIASSFFGAKDVIRLMTPAADLIDLSEVRKPFEDRLKVLQADKETAERQTWKGKINVQAAKRLNVIQTQIADQEAALLQAIQTATAENIQVKDQHSAKTSLKAEHFAAVTLLFELMLFLCLWYGEFYDFRSLAEFAAHTASAPNANKAPSVDAAHQMQYSFSSNGKQAHNGQEAVTDRPVIKGFVNNVRYNAKEGTCLNCGKSLVKKVGWQKYCCEACRLEHHALQHNGRTFSPKKFHSKTT